MMAHTKRQIYQANTNLICIQAEYFVFGCHKHPAEKAVDSGSDDTTTCHIIYDKLIIKCKEST